MEQQKESACQYRKHKRYGLDAWVGKITWSRKWQPTPVFLAGKSYGQRSLAGYSAWDLKESDTTEQLTLLLLLSSIFIRLLCSFPNDIS